MQETMPDISYERNMNHNYLILSKCDFFGMKSNQEKDFRERMLLENHIPGLLPVTHRQINGESRYYYEINSLQSLDRLYDKSEIRYDELKKLLKGCVCLFDRLEEYLLDGTQIIMKPELIYIDVERMEPYFVCYPEYEGDVRLSFMEFIDELLTKIDHTDERAVMIGYQVYRYTRNPNYVVSEIGRMMDHTIVNMVQREKEPEEWNLNTIENQIYDDVCVDNVAEKIFNDTDEEDDCNNDYKAAKSAGDLIGGIFCIFVSLCAGAIVLGARLIKTFQLSRNNELYLCGAMGMSIMAAVLFFSCFIKKRRQDKQLESLGGENEDIEEDNYAYIPQSHYNHYNVETLENARKDNSDIYREKTRVQSCPETICLGDKAVEERVLYGRVNGREMNVSLDRLPMTVGKLASVADLVLNDTAVSKMHARFEEHDGRVYVCDLNSTNGTVRNGVLLGVNQSVKLEPGDRLRFGRTCFTYC